MTSKNKNRALSQRKSVKQTSRLFPFEQIKHKNRIARPKGRPSDPVFETQEGVFGFGVTIWCGNA